jgi:sRNA-binding protein
MTSTDDSVPQETPAPEADAPDAAVDAAPLAIDATPTPDSAAAPGEVQAANEPAPMDTAVAPPPAVAPDLSPAATGARLAELFPALFVGPDGKGTWRAIKLRIHADIQARAPGQFSKRTLGIFFSRYTTTTPYLKALAAPGAQRFDLDGQGAGEIAEEHRAAAVEELARRQAIAAERRAAQRPPRTPARRDAAGEQPAPAPSDRPPRTDRPRPDVRPARPPRGDRREGDVGRGRPEARGTSSPRPPAAKSRPPHANERIAAPPSAPERTPSAALPPDPAQRERLMLLRAFESSPLSKANFCALKRITEAELDAALAQARAERG